MNMSQIAKTAGVSVATVSRVFNQPDKVQPDTRNKILDIVRQDNYIYNYTMQMRPI